MKVHRCFRSIIFIVRRHIIYYYPFYIKNINIQYFVCPPLASNVALIRLSLLSMRFRHSSVGMSRTQDDLMVLISDGILFGCFSATLFFSSVQKFSTGLRSGLFPGHSNNLIFFVLRKSVTIFARRHGAPSCIKISQLCIAMCNSNFSFINSRYFLPSHGGSGIEEE